MKQVGQEGILTMKKMILAGAALATASTPAFAQDGNTLVFELDAEVSVICGVYSFRGQTIPVAFGDLAATDAEVIAQPAVSANYRCNDPAGFTRTISSANNGFLRRTGGADTAENKIAYDMTHGGGSGLQFAYQQLSAPRVDSISGSPALLGLSGQGGTVRFRTNGVRSATNGDGAPGTTVFAGDYTDVVTIAVVSN